MCLGNCGDVAFHSKILKKTERAHEVRVRPYPDVWKQKLKFSYFWWPSLHGLQLKIPCTCVPLIPVVKLLLSGFEFSAAFLMPCLGWRDLEFLSGPPVDLLQQSLLCHQRPYWCWNFSVKRAVPQTVYDKLEDDAFCFELLSGSSGISVADSTILLSPTTAGTWATSQGLKGMPVNLLCLPSLIKLFLNNGS